MSIINVLNEQFAGMTFTKDDLIQGGLITDDNIDMLLKNGVIEEVGFQNYRLSLKGLDVTENILKNPGGIV